ncbi:MAG: galactokinase, partial [Clostridiales bacterium]|nr:galactokinase [Clostridiales bacterium]
MEAQKARYIHALEMFSSTFPGDPSREVSIFSAPGRTEICGNHTDHQRGRVLAAAIDLDMIAIVSSDAENVIRIQSEGYPMIEVDIADVLPREEEKGTTDALVRGVVSQFGAHGVKVSGFDAYITSSVLPGSGLSSSAALEVLIGKIIDCRI